MADMAQQHFGGNYHRQARRDVLMLSAPALGGAAADDRCPYGGWFCTCRGSIHDTFGRLRQGAAALNLAAPSCELAGNPTIRIG
jgi:ubiquinol-cytochrome c reductase iron-sulfur subunit